MTTSTAIANEQARQRASRLPQPPTTQDLTISMRPTPSPNAPPTTLLTPSTSLPATETPHRTVDRIPPVFVHSLLLLRTNTGSVKRLCFNPALGDLVGTQYPPHVAATGSSVKFATSRRSQSPTTLQFVASDSDFIANPSGLQMGDLTAVNRAAAQRLIPIKFSNKIRARMQIAGIHPTLSSLSCNVVTICSTFLTRHDTSGQIEPDRTCRRCGKARVMAAFRRLCRIAPPLDDFATPDGARCRSEIQRCRRPHRFCNCVDGLVLPRQSP